MKRVVTLQDISCAGKCSISVALPVLSCLETETVVIPTSLLSNHTAFESYTLFDLSDMTDPLADGLEKSGFAFDAVYTGYIGSKKQVREIFSFIERFRRTGSLLIVDPAMADDGQLYSGLSGDHSKDMLSLVRIADVIIPNITEACMLLDTEYRQPEQFTEAEIRDMLRSLAGLGPGKVIITGVHTDKDSIGAMCFDRDRDSFSISVRKKHPGTYLGTGDIFASVITGCLLAGKQLESAMESAVSFISLCIEQTEADPEKRWYGVSFEKCLYLLHELVY